MRIASFNTVARVVLFGIALASGWGANADTCRSVGYRTTTTLTYQGVSADLKNLVFQGRLTYPSRTSSKTGVPCVGINLTVKQYGASNPVLLRETPITDRYGYFTWVVPRAIFAPKNARNTTHYLVNADYPGSPCQGNYRLFGSSARTVSVYVNPNGSIQ